MTHRWLGVLLALVAACGGKKSTKVEKITDVWGGQCKAELDLVARNRVNWGLPDLNVMLAEGWAYVPAAWAQRDPPKGQPSAVTIGLPACGFTGVRVPDGVTGTVGDGKITLAFDARILPLGGPKGDPWLEATLTGRGDVRIRFDSLPRQPTDALLEIATKPNPLAPSAADSPRPWSVAVFRGADEAAFTDAFLEETSPWRAPVVVLMISSSGPTPDCGGYSDNMNHGISQKLLDVRAYEARTGKLLQEEHYQGPPGHCPEVAIRSEDGHWSGGEPMTYKDHASEIDAWIEALPDRRYALNAGSRTIAAIVSRR